MMEVKFVCCICGKPSVGYPNNPEPVKKMFDTAGCCNDCNNAFVIPARLHQLVQSQVRGDSDVKD